MAGIKLLLVLSLVNLAFGQVPTDSCNFFDVVDNSMLASNITKLNGEMLATITLVESFAVDLIGQTDRLPTLVTNIKGGGIQALTVVTNYMETIERIATDRTIPVLELLELTEKPFKKLKKVLPEVFEPLINEIREDMGCSMANEVKAIYKAILHQASQIASIIDRLEKVVKDCRRQKDMVLLVRVLSNRVEKITAIIVDARTLFENAAEGITKAAQLLVAVDTARNATLRQMKMNRDYLRRNATALRDSALTIYISGLESIRTNMSAAVRNLTVFDTSRKLSKLTKQFDDGYYKLYQFLRDQNRTEIADIKQYYRRIVKNMEAAASKVSEKFLDAAFRTALKLIDIVLERSPDSDTCFTQFMFPVADPFQALPELILQCTIKEPPRWVSVVETFNATVGLLNITYDQLAQNIAACANFTNFTIDSSHYLQAKACLKTNLEDLNNLVTILGPQLEAIDRAIKLDVDVSKFRVENCLANLLHNNTAAMKVARLNIERCAGRIDDCPRKNRDDDKNDWFARYNSKSTYVDESDEVTSAEKVNPKFFRVLPMHKLTGEDVSYEINSEEETLKAKQ